MAKAKNKNTATDASVDEFLEAVSDGEKQADSWELVELMRRLTGHEPAMWARASSVSGRTTTDMSPAGRET